MRLLGKIALWIVAILFTAVVIFVVATNYQIRATETVAYDADAPGRYITFGGHRWHYLTKGDIPNDPTGAPVLLLHGFIPSGQESFLTLKDKIAEGRGVIAPDYLGYGHSERVMEPGDHYEIFYTAKAIAAVLDELGVKEVDVLGHSYGGVIAAQFALDYPQRVRRIVFMSSAQYVDISATKMYETGLGIGRAMTWHITSGPLSFLGNSCKASTWCTWAPYALIKDNTDAVRAAMSTNYHSPTLAAFASRLPEISAPSLVVIGDRDFIVPLGHAERLAGELQNGKLVVIEGANHMPYRQKPDETLKAVLDFLQPST